MGGVEQSHHQLLIGHRVAFLITASPQWPAHRGGDSKHKEVCQLQCVNKLWQSKKGQCRSDWLQQSDDVSGDYTIRRGCFLNTGLASMSYLPLSLKMWKQKKRSENFSSFHVFSKRASQHWVSLFRVCVKPLLILKSSSCINPYTHAFRENHEHTWRGGQACSQQGFQE